MIAIQITEKGGNICYGVGGFISTDPNLYHTDSKLCEPAGDVQSVRWESTIIQKRYQRNVHPNNKKKSG